MLQPATSAAAERRKLRDQRAGGQEEQEVEQESESEEDLPDVVMEVPKEMVAKQQQRGNTEISRPAFHCPLLFCSS